MIGGLNPKYATGHNEHPLSTGDTRRVLCLHQANVVIRSPNHCAHNFYKEYRMFCVNFESHLPSVSGEDEHLNSLLTNRRTDDRQHVIRKADLNFQLRYANTLYH